MNQDILDKVFDKIEENWSDELSFLQALGRYPSILGNEAAIQEYIYNFLRHDLGLETEKVYIDPKRLSTLPGYSPPEWSYTDRPVVIGQWKNKGDKIGKNLILQGHIDVVSPEPTDKWNYDPWGATIVGNKMYGRGIQDMKSGIAAMIFALKAIKECQLQLGADVIVQTVIEEECTGNGALAALEHNSQAEGALIPEPFGPIAVVAQVGVIWLRIKVLGSGAHVERADRSVNAIEKAMLVIQALKQYEQHINKKPKPEPFKQLAHPLNVNIGVIRAGDWPSNVPSECVLEVRVGFYPEQNPEDVKEELKQWIWKASEQDEWLREHKPQITFFGFHAEGLQLNSNNPLFQTLEQAHYAVTKEALTYQAITATTDLRFFNLYYGIPATCYGPIGGNMHGLDEWVDLNSVKLTTKTYAAFILNWCKIRKTESLGS